MCGCGCDCMGEEECVGRTVLIAALKYVCVSGGVWGECVGVIVWVCGFDCVGEEGNVWVGQP